MMKTIKIILGVVSLFLLVGCTTNGNDDAADQEEEEIFNLEGFEQRRRTSWWSTDRRTVATDGEGDYQPDALFLEAGYYKVSVHLEGVHPGVLRLFYYRIDEDGLLERVQGLGYISDSNSSVRRNPHRWTTFGHLASPPLEYAVFVVPEDMYFRFLARVDRPGDEDYIFNIVLYDLIPLAADMSDQEANGYQEYVVEASVEVEVVDLELDVAHELLEDGRLLVDIRSNLPDGTRMMTTVRDHVRDATFQDSGYFANGELQTGPFSAGGEALPTGEYEIRLTLPISAVQSEEVRPYLGEDYANFNSPLFEYGVVGRILSYVFHIIVE